MIFFAKYYNVGEAYHIFYAKEVWSKQLKIIFHYSSKLCTLFSNRILLKSMDHSKIVLGQGLQRTIGFVASRIYRVCTYVTEWLSKIPIQKSRFSFWYHGNWLSWLYHQKFFRANICIVYIYVLHRSVSFENCTSNLIENWFNILQAVTNWSERCELFIKLE